MPVVRRWRIAFCFAIFVVAICGGDWIVFRIRDHQGNAFRRVTVEQYVVISLKGSKEEYNYVGTTIVDCARSLLPQYTSAQWTAPCWWRERHKTLWIKAADKSDYVPAEKAVLPDHREDGFSAAFPATPGGRSPRRGSMAKAAS